MTETEILAAVLERLLRQDYYLHTHDWTPGGHEMLAVDAEIVVSAEEAEVIRRYVPE